MTDCLVVGGGVVGLSTAFELAGRGLRVRIVEQRQFGREASWAGAGILPPGRRESARTPEARLRGYSCELWPAWSQQLLELTTMDNGFRVCGGLSVAVHSDPAALDDELQAWQGEGVDARQISGDQARELEPFLDPEITAACWLPELAQVRNPRHLRALTAGCMRRGVQRTPGVAVTQLVIGQGRIQSVRTAHETITAGQVLIAGGAWSGPLLAQAGCQVPLRPVLGQIVLLNVAAGQLRHVIQDGPRYIVPREDGRVLVGATEEDAGFEKRNTAEGVEGLLAFARSLVPALARAPFEQAWSGLRPCSADGLPYLGAVPGVENLYVAAGHFRSGLQMSPGTAVLMADLMTGAEPAIPLTGLGCDRAANG